MRKKEKKRQKQPQKLHKQRSKMQGLLSIASVAMASFLLMSCEKVLINNCPVAIIPSEQALQEVKSVIDTKPALYDYVDAIGVREKFIANGCK